MPMPIASLRMYDFPEILAFNEAWWSGLARHFRAAGVEDVPDRLSRDGDHKSAWRSPELCLAQACGYPLTHDFHGLIQVVATLCYTAPGCAGAHYTSVIVVKETSRFRTLADLRGAVAGYNSMDSHSGYNVFRAMLAPLAEDGRFLGDAIEIGGHMASLLAVQQGVVDVAAIDCVTFALAKRHRPVAVNGLRMLAESPPAPGLPYVTSALRSKNSVERMRRGLLAALADPVLAPCREALLILGAELLPEGAYQAMVLSERDALRRGYPILA